MTDTEAKYKILIDRLKNAKPRVADPDLLTDEIMLSISLQNRNTASRLIVWVRPLMTAAALFLLGLFLYQQLETHATIQDFTLVKSVKPSFLNKINCSSESTLKLSENRKLINQYICYMRNNMAENENSKQFYLKYLPEQRLK